MGHRAQHRRAVQHAAQQFFEHGGPAQCGRTPDSPCETWDGVVRAAESVAWDPGKHAFKDGAGASRTRYHVSNGTVARPLWSEVGQYPATGQPAAATATANNVGDFMP